MFGVRAIHFCTIASICLLLPPASAAHSPLSNLSFSVAVSVTTVPLPKPTPDWAKETKAVPRKALIVGISDYDHASGLTTPKHDAEIVAASVQSLNFETRPEFVIKGRLDRRDMLSRIRQYTQSLSDGDIAFVYFSGHGLERDGVNYLVPSTGVANSASPGHDYVSLAYIMDLLEERRVAAAIILLDACRTDPFADADSIDSDVLEISGDGTAAVPTHSSESISQPVQATPSGLAMVDTGPAAMLLVYAAQPQRPAYSLFKGDDASLGSIFTRTVAYRLKSSSSYPIKDIISLAETDVFELTKQNQKPFQNPFGMLYLMLAANPHLKAWEEETWGRSVSATPASEQIKALREFLRVFPGSEHSFAARRRLATLTTRSGMAMLADGTWNQVLSASSTQILGDLQSIGTKVSDGTMVAGANRDLVLRQNWGGVFPSAAVGTIRTGEVVEVIDVHRSGNAVRILTEDGRIGYVGNLSVAESHARSAKAQVVFPGSGPADQPTDWTALEKLADRAAVSGSIFRVSSAAEKERGISDQIGLLRALRIRDVLIAKGVSPDRVTIEAADSDLPSQTVQIERIEIVQ